MTIPLPGRTLPPSSGTFRALRVRDFRLLWTGQVFSLTGTWIQSVAQGWLVLRLTDSAFYLGLVGFMSYLPVLLFALPAGVVADRLPRRRSLIVIQTFAMLMALTLALLTWLDIVRVWHVALLALGHGTVAAFDIPIRQSLLQDLVGRDDLPNAIALNSMAFNGARLLGPALAGFLLAAYGEALCFLLNGLSFTAVLASLLRMRPVAAAGGAGRGSWIGEARRGLSFAAGSVRARGLLGLVVVSSVFGMPYAVLMPVFARDVLQEGSRGLGLLMGAAGLGALLGALLLAARRKPDRSGTLVAGAMAAFGSGLIAFALSREFALSLALLVVVGGAMLVQLATSNTLLQLMAPPELRGRIVSLYMLAFLGMAPLGALLGGAAARAVGAPRTVLAGGVVCLLTACWFATRIPRFRRAAGAGDPAADAAAG